MRTVLLLALFGCGSDETTVPCAEITQPDSNACRIDTDGLYADPQTMCVTFWENGQPFSDCVAVGAGNVTVSKGRWYGGKRGLIVSVDGGDPLFTSTCVFRECQ